MFGCAHCLLLSPREQEPLQTRGTRIIAAEDLFHEWPEYDACARSACLFSELLAAALDTSIASLSLPKTGPSLSIPIPPTMAASISATAFRAVSLVSSSGEGQSFEPFQPPLATLIFRHEG
jgi:hypothetical protein